MQVPLPSKAQEVSEWSEVPTGRLLDTYNRDFLLSEPVTSLSIRKKIHADPYLTFDT